MKVNPKKLGKILQKASFNYMLDGVKLLFDKEKITCTMIPANPAYAVRINTPNDVMSGISANESVELNLDLKDKEFYRDVFNQFDSNECETLLTDEYFKIIDGGFEAKFIVSPNLKEILYKEPLPEFNVTTQIVVDINEKLVTKVLQLCETV